MTFDVLVHAIREAHQRCVAQAAKAVNASLSLRNWIIGHHIVEYEQRGSDRAAYGEQLLERLADRLQAAGLERTDARELRRYRQFRVVYPQIREALTPESGVLPLEADNESTDQGSQAIRESPTPELTTPGRVILHSLSFTHLSLLLQIEEPRKRAFYEQHCIQGGWSVRELRRQIVSLYFERSGLSRDTETLAALAQQRAEVDSPALAIRDPYVFEFLGLKPREVMHESALEDALLDKLQEFLLELRRGFCFEARQKRMLIGGESFFVDLVFYHRILKCHVLIELKADEFHHEHLGQLNTYVNWYQQNEAGVGDNPPIVLLLCTTKNQALAEYALGGMNNRLFVTRYQLELPTREEMQRFLESQNQPEPGRDPEM